VETTYGFPRTDPGAALAAADELSRRYPEGSIRRLNADNSVDFVGMEGAFLRHRRFHLHRIDAEGWVSLVRDDEAPPAYRFGVALVFLAAILFVGAMLLTMSGLGERGAGVLAVSAVVSGLVGGLTAERAGLMWFVRDRFGTDDGWQHMVSPTSWGPTTVAQFNSVEAFVDSHGGHAYARPLPDGAAEVVLSGSFREEHYLVSVFGRVEQLSSERALRFPIGMMVNLAGILAWLPLTVFVGVGVASAVVALMLLGGSLLAHSGSLETRLERTNPGEWHRVQTQAFSD